MKAWKKSGSPSSTCLLNRRKRARGEASIVPVGLLDLWPSRHHLCHLGLDKHLSLGLGWPSQVLWAYVNLWSLLRWVNGQRAQLPGDWGHLITNNGSPGRMAAAGHLPRAHLNCTSYSWACKALELSLGQNSPGSSNLQDWSWLLSFSPGWGSGTSSHSADKVPWKRHHMTDVGREVASREELRIACTCPAPLCPAANPTPLYANCSWEGFAT